MFASTGSLDISSRFSICGHQLSFDSNNFRTIQCLREVISEAFCCLGISLLAVLAKHDRQAAQKNIFSTEKATVFFF